MIPDFKIPDFQLGPLSIDSFSLLVALGFIVGTHLAARRARQVGLDEKVMYDFGLLSILFGITGAHLVVVFVYHPEEFMKRPLWIFQIWSGISSWGGFLGAAIAIYVYVRNKKLHFMKYADALMFGMVPGWFLGRMGCFSVHDHLGRLTTFPLAIHFSNGPRHDLGLYEALWMLPLMACVYFIGRKKSSEKPRPGFIFGFVFVSYTIIRFSLDFLRASDLAVGSEPRYFGLTPAQYFCIAGSCFGAWRLRRNMRPNN